MIQNQNVPDESPKAIPFLIDFSVNTTWILDLELVMSRTYITMVQTLFLDLSGSANPLKVTVSGSGQVILAKANTQGYYQILASNPVKLQFDSTVAPNIIPIQLINVSIPGVVWPTV